MFYANTTSNCKTYIRLLRRSDYSPGRFDNKKRKKTSFSQKHYVKTSFEIRFTLSTSPLPPEKTILLNLSSYKHVISKGIVM